MIDLRRRGARVMAVARREHLLARLAAYCAAKHGLLGLMRATAIDLARHQVTCNAVLPGWVRTEMPERSAEQESAVTVALGGLW